MSRRVVITGLGTVCGFGMGIHALWDSLVAGRTSLGPVRSFDPSGFACRLAAEAVGFSAKDHVPKNYRKAVKVMARDIELAVGAAKSAVEDAGILTRGSLGDTAEATATTYRPGRMGCHIGAGLIASETLEMTAAMATAADSSGRFDLRRWGESGMENLTPLWLLKYLPNMLACHVTIIHGAEGPSNTITCAEASGLLSIGESVRVIERGAADACLAGGAESKVNLMGFAKQSLMGRLAPTGDETDGSRVVKPFAPDAAGTLLGEGGGILVLEERESALARGAKAYAEVVGFGSSQSSPDYEDGERDEGMRWAIESALNEAGIDGGRVGTVIPLGCGVKAMDAAEWGAMSDLLGAGARVVRMTPSIGACMAGAGALQAAVGAMCAREGVAPEGVTINLGRPDNGRRQDYVLVMTCSLGGQNAALLLRAA